MNMMTATSKSHEPRDPKAPSMKLTRFDFEHRIFKIEGAYFFKSKMDDKVLLHVSLGEQDAAIFTNTLVTEFGIKTDSQDYALLNLVEKSLEHVKFIAPGDEVPSEILDGTASWKIDEVHYQRAKDRLMVHLANWVTGSTADEVDLTQVGKMLEKKETQALIQEGFSRAADELGLDKGHREKVVGMLEQLARELAYIEALRDHYQRILTIERDIKVARTTLRGDKSAMESAMRASQLLMPVFSNYRGSFENVDAQTAEVMAALKNIDNVIGFVRKTRDTLHRETLTWSDLLDKWNSGNMDKRNPANKAVGELYRFSAQNFLETNSWL
jgi:hypothetical protein